MSVKFAIVGEAWGAEEEKARRPFVGASGKLLRECLHRLGVNNYTLHNVVSARPPGNDFINTYTTKDRQQNTYPPISLKPRRYFKDSAVPHITKLYQELVSRDPEVILCVGNFAMWALTGKVGIMGLRGSALPDWGHSRVFATVHPAAVLRQYPLRAIFMADIAKANMKPRELDRIVYVPETAEDLLVYEHRFMHHDKPVACDIETEQYEITEVGFSGDVRHGLTIPFKYSKGHYWDEANEILVWQTIHRWCREYPIIGQNFTYDLQYLWKKAGVPMINIVGDTMIQHHTLQPEMQKSLGFLASLYTYTPAWKHLRRDNKEKE